MNLETDRLCIKEITKSDAPFFLELLNTPSYKKFIADRKISTIADAEVYLKDRLLKHHKAHGYGYYKILERATDQIAGIVGYLNREELAHVDIGFALLPEFEGKGIAYEASKALLDFGRDALNFQHVVAIVQPNNPRSIKLLEKLGLSYEKTISSFDESEELLLFAINFEA